MVDLPAHADAGELVRRAAAEDVLITPWSATRVRAVTHLDVDRRAVGRAAAVVARCLEAA